MFEGHEFDSNMHEEYSDEDCNSVHFVGQRIYLVRTCHLFYTTYDLQWDSDTINPWTHPNIMLRSPEKEEGAEAYWYARVIGIYHANVWVDRTDIPDAHRVKRMDFLWVCWFRKELEYISGSHRAHLPKVGFVESTDEFVFSFIDPVIVIHGCHLIPAFYEGHTIDLLPVPQSISQCLNPGDDDNWVNFYVNM